MKEVEGAETSIPEAKPDKSLSRREFLKRFRNALAGIAISQPGAKQLAELAQTIEQRRAVVQQEHAMPTDLLSREELAAHFHTHIYDLSEADFPGEYVELFLRRSVAETRLFQMLKEGRLLGMDILLIDSYKVDPEKFTPAQRELMARHPTILNGLQRQIEKAKESNRSEIEEHREAMRAEHAQKLQELDVQSASLNPDQYQVRLQALNYTYGRYLSDEPSEEDLQELVIKGYSPTLGTATDEQGRTGPHNFVFMAVRERPAEVTFTSGSESLTIPATRIPYRESLNDSLRLEDQSYPTPEDFTVAEDANSLGYVVLGGPSWGYVLRHELQHSRGVFDEESADRGFLAEIAEAARHMQETGSDEKYWAVFRTPQGVIITDSRFQPTNL
jgi:hypothetical protein